MKSIRRIRRDLMNIVLLLATASLYQNCAPGFSADAVQLPSGEAIQEDPTSTSTTSTTVTVPTVSTTTTTNPAVTTTTTRPSTTTTQMTTTTSTTRPPVTTTTSTTVTTSTTTTTTTVPTATKLSYILLGGNGRMRAFQYDASKKMITDRGQVTAQGTVGGIAKYGNQIVTVNSGSGATLEAFNVSNHIYTSLSKYTFQSESVFVSFAKDFNKLLIFGASYNGANAVYATVDDESFTSYAKKKTITYPSGSKTHSTSYSSQLKMLFVANLGESKVHAYQVTVDNLVLKTSIDVPTPRNVVYDEVYKKLYVATEANSGASYVKIYQQDASGKFSEVNSFTMGLRGSDLKINHDKNILVTLVRELGQESIEVLPLTTDGFLDSQRLPVRIPLNVKEPRSVSISDDGKSLFLTPNATNTRDLIVYELQYGANKEISQWNKILEFEAGNEGFVSNYSYDQ